MSDVVDLGAAKRARSNDNRDWTVEECLEDCLRDVRSGDRPANKALVLFLDTDEDEGSYRAGWAAANLRSSEMLSLMEAIKISLLRDMGYT